ncbi:S8 family serine peptidase [Actinacidiphila rubida]|uniref:S8 family serine peptidase n=1 Tax=Actinacidiphila rubida TaxID=310780 RepID=UPI001FE5ADA7|nr:S8 family serine peptidase [Actinacidiphila rubida]
MPLVPVPRTWPVALAAITALAAGALPATAAAPLAAPRARPAVSAAAPQPHGTARTVTLITGDKVTLGTAADGSPVNSFQSPRGASAGYHRAVVDGATYVYPDAALPYVAAGTLDKQLFNVTRLIADGYDDAHSARLPLIVRYTDAAARARTRPKVAGSSVVRALNSIQGAALAQDHAQATAFWSALTGGTAASTARSAHPALGGGVAKVWLDGRVTADLADSTAQIGAPQVWAQGNTGAGVKVAVLDTGVDSEHPDLAGQVGDTSSFVPSEPDTTDWNGHGTHVASTIAGTGSASDGKERGVAPGARLEIGKVLNSEGSGQESWIIAGMQWAAQDEQAKIISMSLGGGGDADDPMSQAVDQLSRDTGALFVIAAGNGGPHSIGSPGAADDALTVGAVDSSDHLADFSSQGPRVGDDGLKPEITAPGVDIVAARSHYTRGAGYYTTMSGTSMATPHVAGTAALLAAAHPDWTGTQLKEALVSSAHATPAYTPYQAGAGRVDALAAVHASVFATTTAFAGFHTWPVTPGGTDVRKVTYTNTGDTPADLDLAVDAAGAPAGLFDLSAGHVSIPAHGTASVDLTTHLDRLVPDQPVSGMVVGTDAGGTVRARTLIGGAQEGQRQTLTVTAKDRSGNPLSGTVMLTTPHLWTTLELDASGTGKARMPVGSYSGWLISDVQGASGPHSRGMALLSFNDVSLDQDRTVTLDARQARRIAARVPGQTTPVAPRLEVLRSFPDTLVETTMLPNESYDSIWALPTGKKVTDGTFEFGARFRLEEPALTLATGKREYVDPLVKRAAVPLPAGTRKLAAVYAGDGSALASRHDLGGKAVVVRADGVSDIQAQAEAAAAAGARLLVVVNNGTGRMDPWDESPWSPLSPAPLTVATLDADQGADLIAAIGRGDGTLTVDSHPTTDYLYDVVHHWSGGVPADPTWSETRDSLARVDVSFRNYRQGKAMEYRTDVWHGWVDGNQLTAPAQGERTDWVTSGVDWVDDAFIVSETGQHAVDVLHYTAGRPAKVTWFGPIQRPRMGPAYQPVRYLDTMYVVAPGWGDSGHGHVGEAGGNFDVKDWVSLYQGDRQLDWGNAEWLQVPGLAADRLPYRLVVDNDRAAWADPYSTHTLTEWDFTSAGTGADAAVALPLIQLDYAVDTDTAGRADRHADLTVTASQLPGVTAAVGRPSVDISYDDGTTWQHAGLDHRGDGWRTSLHAPKSAGFATLRVTARDAAGDTVSQTITRAFGLR